MIMLVKYRGTSPTRKHQFPQDPPRTLGIGLRQGPRGVRFLVSEVPLKSINSPLPLRGPCAEGLSEGSFWSCNQLTLPPSVDPPCNARRPVSTVSGEGGVKRKEGKIALLVEIATSTVTM